jgi:predicted nuclease of predicted toxin-antitoxin system
MIIWIDGQLPQAIAAWISNQFDVQAVALWNTHLRYASDYTIFLAAKHQKAVIMTKDRDFIQLVEAHGQPPQVIWITCGNTSNARLQEILTAALPKSIELLESGEKFVEISGDP